MKNKKQHVLKSVEEMVRTSLGLDSDTLLIDEIVEIAKEFPDNANAVDPSTAIYLAGRFLKAMNLCNELYSLSVGFELKCDIKKKKVHGDAFIVRSKTKGLKTAKEMEAYANTDEEYVAAADRHVEAKMLRVLVENIRSDYEKAHYLMRKIAEKDIENDSSKHTNKRGSADDSDWSRYGDEEKTTSTKSTQITW